MWLYRIYYVCVITVYDKTVINSSRKLIAIIISQKSNLTGLETYFFSNSQTFASGFYLNSQIAVPYSQLVLLLFQRLIRTIMHICCPANLSYGLNLKGTQLSSYWFLKLLKVHRWHFSVKVFLLSGSPSLIINRFKWQKQLVSPDQVENADITNDTVHCNCL